MNLDTLSNQSSRSWHLVALLITLVYALAAAISGPSKFIEVFGVIGVLIATAVATYFTFYTSQKNEEKKTQRSWTFVGAGLLLWSIAFAIRGISTSIFSLPLGIPSIVDLLRIAGVFAILAALGLYPASPERGFGRIRILLDVILLVIGGLTLYWLIYFRSVFLVGISDPIPSFWSLIHAGLDISLIPLCLRIVLLKSGSRERNAFSAFVVACLFFTIADLVYGYRILQGREALSSFVSASRAAASLFVVIASKFFLGELRTARRSVSLRVSRISAKQLEALLPIIFAYAVVGFILIDWLWISQDLDWVSIRSAIIMVVLLIARQGVIIGQSELRRFAELVNAASDFAFITNTKGEIRLTNPALRKALRFSDAEEPPKLMEFVKSGSSLDTVLSIASVSGWSGEVTYVRTNGVTFPGSLSLFPIRDSRQQEVLFAATGHDLTQIKQRESELRSAYDDLAAAQRELEILNAELEKKVDIRTKELKEMVTHLDKLNKELQALDELKTEFVALVSHELRAPLTTIGTGLEVLLQSRPELDDGTKETIQLITEETARLAGFVETILDISALEAGRFPIHKRPLSLPDLLQEVVIQITDEPMRDRIKIEIPDQFPPLVADEQGMRSVLYHVLDNAIKYAPQGEVHLGVSENGEEVIITVRDQGPGIPKVQRDRVFDMFYRIDSSDSREVYGRGLGLTLTKRYLDVMGGSIEILDPGERGTLVKIRLPK